MPQAPADTSRERIIDAAEECFGRFGVSKTTVEDIAAAAGLSRATVYRSITGGRDELILAVILRDLRRFLDRLTVRLAGETSVNDTIVEGVLDAVTFMRDDPKISQLLVPEAAGHTQAAIAGAVEQVLALCGDHVRPYFEVAQREGTLRPDIDVEGSIEFLFRIISSMIALARNRSADETRSFLRTYVVPALVVDRSAERHGGHAQ